jgi:hypothetical protein
MGCPVTRCGWLAIAGAFALASCAPAPPATSCHSSADCPAGYACDPGAKLCQRTLDAATADASAVDQTVPDAIVRDALVSDAMVPDASQRDGANQDALAPADHPPLDHAPLADAEIAVDGASPADSARDVWQPEAGASDAAIADRTVASDLVVGIDTCVASCAGRCGSVGDGCGGSCTEPCAMGAWCSASWCAPCNTADHCGPGCISCDYGLRCGNGSCNEVGPAIDSWIASGGDGSCDRIDVQYPDMNFGAEHWSEVHVFDAATGVHIGPMSNYRQGTDGCPTYFPGDATWPHSYYRFDGTPVYFRSVGLPRYVKFRFVDVDGYAISGYSPQLDLGPS